MKPILCFHVGYIPDLNDENVKTTYGSEIALVNISKLLSKKYRVLVFGSDIHKEITVDNVEYYNSDKFELFQNENEIEIIILLRYIFPFIDFELKSKKIFLWLQDIHPLPYYKSLSFSDFGKYLLKNMIDKIDGIVTLTNWHKNFISNFYEIESNKIHIIGNAINIEDFKKNIQKQNNKFIWTSHGGRGAYKLLEYFHEIRKRIPDAELYIYRDKTAFSPQVLEEMEKYDYFHFGDKLENNQLIEEFQTSEFWFYPTDFEETYCISALEAQMAKCICICTDLGGLTETVGDRGILIRETIWSEEYKNKAIEEIINLTNNENLKEKYKEIGYKWAIQQTWKNRAKQWFELFKRT